MHKRFKRSSLNKFLGHEAVSSEVAHSHVYGKAARASHSVPRARPTARSPRGHVVPGYRDSMVGSIAQYRDKTPIPPKVPDNEKTAQSSEGVIGNRPKSGTNEKGQIESASARRQHHFIEPPKRNFNRFN